MGNTKREPRVLVTIGEVLDHAGAEEREYLLDRATLSRILGAADFYFALREAREGKAFPHEDQVALNVIHQITAAWDL
jgi:hypothetical protein